MRTALYIIAALFGIGLGKALGPDLFALLVTLLRDPLARMLCIVGVGLVWLVITVRRDFKE